MTNPKTALERAISAVGGQTALANQISASSGRSVKQGHVWKWLHKSGGVTADYVIDVARATDWEVTPHQLRPDLYPNEKDALPDTAA